MFSFGRSRALLLLALLAFVPATSLRSQSAGEILEGARLTPTVRPTSLRAQIRGEGKPTPLLIRLRNGVIRYEFADPAQTLLLRLGADRTELLETRDGKTVKVSGKRLHDPIRDTGITYQDLSLRFLYWPSPVLGGEETVRTRPCWKIDLQAPADEPVYGVARVWIDKDSGAILRIEGYDKQGLLLRRFEIVSAQKINGLWMLRQMRIERFNPGNPSPVSRRYLEVLGETGNS
jgi:hypothetical protein